MLKYFILCCFFVLSTLCKVQSSEITQAEINSKSYLRDYFIPFNAQNALEMIQRIPGFTIRGGGSARGFSSNAGNVLIDGARPTTKSGGLNSVLVRIPAGQVKYIQILRGSSDMGSDTAGQSLIANVIREQNVSNGTWDLRLRRSVNDLIKPELKASYSSQLGDWQTSSEASIGIIPGYISAFRQNVSSNNQSTSETKETTELLRDFIILNTEFSLKTNRGLLVLNGRLEDRSRDNNTYRLINNIGSNDETWQLKENETSELLELSADWTQKSDQWRWRLLTLAVLNNKEYNNKENTEQIINNSIFPVGLDTYQEDTLNSELILRSTFGKITQHKFKPELGFEIANNQLDTNVKSVVNGIEEALSNTDVIVSEIRAELFVNATYQLSEKLSLDGNITFEFSKISVDGDSTIEQNFNFLKSKIVANYQLTPKQLITVELEKRVNQLNFNNFSSSAEANDDRTTAGNPNIVPTKINMTSIAYDWQFNEQGVLNLKFFYQWRDDVLENIFLVSGEQGLGNAGKGKLWGLNTNVTLPLNSLLDNSNIILSHNYRGSRFFDEIIDENRALNNIRPIRYSARFRQDITSHIFAWGVNYFNESYIDRFEVDEQLRIDKQGRYSVFIESGFIQNIKTTFSVFRVNSDKQKTRRMFFTEDRNSARNGDEIIDREDKFSLRLSLSGNF